MRRFLSFILLFFLFAHINAIYAQQLTENQIKASYIYNFAINIDWPDQDKIDTFKILILGKNTELFRYLTLMKKTKVIHGKPVNVFHYPDITEYNDDTIQVVYVSPELNDELNLIYWHFAQLPVLIVTDDATKLIYSMINFYKQGNAVKFIINEQNIKSAGLTINRELLVLGGSQAEIYGIYKQMEQEIQHSRKLLEQQQKRLDSLSTIVDQQINLIRSQKQVIDNRQKKIANLEKTLSSIQTKYERAQAALDSLQATISERERYLAQRNLEIAAKVKEISKLKDNIEDQKRVYNSLLKSIAEKQKLLKEKEAELNQYQRKVSLQRRSILMLIIILVLVAASFAAIYFSLLAIRRKNKELKEANDLISMQAEELKVVNMELEKVSLAASKTDNVVLILSPYGTIEWVNDALERHYGYTKEDYVGKKLYEVSSISSEQIMRFLEQCRVEKKTIVYENYFRKADGSYIWVQTTLTPVLGPNGDVIKIIALDADITKLKLASYEIEKKNEELLLQHEFLVKQKKQIEDQNRVITSSIEYARAIQGSIMPPDSEIRKVIKEYFLIFRPLQTVSGDFYWMAIDDKDTDSFYLAVVDCTGHGVPGAFMSLIAERLLDEIIFMRGIRDPNMILKEMDKQIINIIGTKEDSEQETLAGLDMILLQVKKKDDVFDIVFSGAKRPLVYYIPGQRDIEIIKTDRYSIGQDLFLREKEKEFTNYYITVPQNTQLYLFTDGITDQYCSFLKRKIGSLRIFDIIREMKDFPFHKQKETLENYLNYCLEGEDQRDDITFWAIRL